MADKPKTRSDATNDLPDNTSGAISPQDVRRGVLSAFQLPGFTTVTAGDGGSGSRSNRATAVQNAINRASNDSDLIGVVVPDEYLNYDASSVTFDNSVRMVREGQQADVYDVKAYGAAIDGSTDDEPAVSAALSAASAASGGEVVAEDATSNIVIGAQVTIPNDVVARFRATAVPDTDHDLFFLDPGGELYAKADVTGVTWTSAVLTLDPTVAGGDYWIRRKTRFDLETVGSTGEGTALFLHQNSANDFISWVEGKLHLNGFQKAIDIHSEGAGWINGNVLEGTLRGATTFIHLRGPGAISGNRGDFEVQPLSGSSEVVHFAGGDMERNRFSGFIWDLNGNLNNSVIFDGGHENVVEFEGSGFVRSMVAWNAGSENKIIRKTRQGVEVVQQNNSALDLESVDNNIAINLIDPGGGIRLFNREGQLELWTGGQARFSINPDGLAKFNNPHEVFHSTVANLPAAGIAGRVAFATDGRKDGETAGNGTGVLVYDDGSSWISVDTASAVQA